MPGGPQPYDHAQRMERAMEIVRQVCDHFGERLLALAIYGSLARGTDGPYSDIEIFCILKEEGHSYTIEWSTGSWKAELNVFSPEKILDRAVEVEGDWAVSHGAVVAVLPIIDPTGFFPRLRGAVYSQPEQVFNEALKRLIVEEVYECMGKIRNAQASHSLECLPSYALQIAHYGACLVGMANRYLYTTGSKVFPESLTLPGRPKGYDELCWIVMSGELNIPSKVLSTVEAFWAGLEAWAADRGLQIEEELAILLQKSSES